MPKQANKKTDPSSSNPSGSSEELPFEDALKKLEGIVEEMESEELPLEKLLARFEQGTQLAKACQSKLADAELKIQQLEQKTDGEMALKPLQVDPDADPSESE